MPERIERARPSRLSLVIIAAVALPLLGLIAHGNYAGSGDALHYMVIARSVAFDRDLDVGNDYADPSSIITEPHGNHAQVGRNGVLRPVHDVGLPLIAAPYFAVAYELAAMTDSLPPSLRRRAKLSRFIALRQLMCVFMIAVTAGLAMVFFHASWRMTGEKTVAFLWTILWTLSPPILSHGYVFFTEVPSALVALLVYSRRGDLTGDAPGRRGFVLGLLLGLLPLIHVRNVGLVVALAAIILWRVRSDLRRSAGFVGALAIMGAVKLGLNLLFWGSAFVTPHERPGAWPGVLALASETTVRTFGLLFDARHGLLPSAPIYLLVPAAWFMLRRRSRTEAYELLFLVVSYLALVVLPITNVHGWRGGWSPAARFLVPIAPFAGLAVPLLRQANRGRVIVWAIVALQAGLDIFLWGHPMLMWSEGPGPAPFLVRLIGPSLSALVPSWEVLTPALAAPLVACLGVWIALTWTLTGAESRRGEPAV